MPSDPRPAVRIAARWWREQLERQAPIDIGGADQDPDAATTNLFAAAFDTRTPVAPEAAEGFEQALASRLEEHVAAAGGSITRASIGVDYHPEGPLWDALDDAGLLITRHIDSGPRAGEDYKYEPLGILPLKTGMWVHDDRVEVKAGYAAPWETIWSAEVGK